MLAVDAGVPDVRFEQAQNRAGEDLRRRLMAWEGIVIHCCGGLGRTGIVAARLLAEFGEAPESALFRVRRARTGTVENQLQDDYVRGLERLQDGDTLNRYTSSFRG